ncbi:acylphosphatase [Cerasicoccus arenae]|uniref:acylphosphatase n=1 Tax=Cerasicoccus arenae TaxID=424488 RepID=A0A8J3GCB3_9BACT|nr:acylphosphatase [Cerasicoccus arenae]MBK1859522.1 acylphosphatase [Cerasicoccus arenae]GHB97117.1 acylphosphatase [Cerasicoccus arenae]
MPDSIYREEVHFTGRVQGVGFRYATLQAAKEFEVTGEVKNLPDGRVQLVAEGKESEVTAFREEVQDRLKPFIREIDLKRETCPPNYRSFEITR